MTKLIDRISGPSDLKRLGVAEMRILCQEIRDLLIQTVTQTGGHLASNLGVVELTVALHVVFDSPRDKIVWDVGHQSYVHKLLTGRKDQFHTIRQFGGLSGFPDRAESPHDPFGAGHASTSVSAGLGMALARDLKGENHNVVAVIGDGSLTGGLAFEGINNAGHLKSPLIIVLNDNQMSISPNVGALAQYLGRIRIDPHYHRAKVGVEHALTRIPLGKAIVEGLKRIKQGVKGLVIPTMVWEELGLTYLGPVDGHDLRQLVETLKIARMAQRPIIVHVCTRKGKGYTPAELDAVSFHGVPPNGKAKSSTPSYTSVFGDALLEIAKQDSRVVAITAAMREGTGLTRFASRFPGRFFDVGIAEQHAVTFAAGLASQGIIPIVAVYSTFLQRGYDQVVHDVCTQNLPVVFAIDRAGIVGDDGRTHQGAFDISYLRHIPNLVVMSPKDENELRQMLWTAVSLDQPVAIRYPRGAGVGVPLSEKPSLIRLGEAETLRKGRHLAILALGAPVYPCLQAAELLEIDGIHATVINARFAKPLDEMLIINIARRFKHLVTAEENALAGGFGSAVLELLQSRGITDVAVKRLGIPDEFVPHGTQTILRGKCSLTAEGIAQAVVEAFPELRIGPLPLAAGGA